MVEFEYLNLRIIQTQHGISFDQTKHTQKTIASKFFPPETTEHLKSPHTPFRTDSQFETNISENLLATEQQLLELLKQYGGTYAEIIGQLMHLFVWTRPDLWFFCTWHDQYIQAPNATAFAALHRGLRYVATNFHYHIVYHHKMIDGYNTLCDDFDPPKFEGINLPNGLIIAVDSDNAQDNRTCRSCHSIIALVNNVSIDWKTEQQECIALHSTDSETRGAFQLQRKASSFKMWWSSSA